MTKRHMETLQERYDDACSELVAVLEDNKRLLDELRYCQDFIHWKGMEEDFKIFQRIAHEDKDSDVPFPRLIVEK